MTQDTSGSLTACEPARPARATCWPFPFQAWQLAHAPSKMRRPVPSFASPPGDHAVDVFTAALTGITAAAASADREILFAAARRKIVELLFENIGGEDRDALPGQCAGRLASDSAGAARNECYPAVEAEHLSISSTSGAQLPPHF
jgi:hypothetical protein